MKTKINMVNQDSINKKTHETDLIDEILKNEFFKMMKDSGFDFNVLKEMFESKRITVNEQFKFNICIRRVKKELNMSFIDCVVFIEEYFAKLKKVIGILDEESMCLLKNELADKYKLNIPKSKLDEFLNAN
jgi:hypothetical protein